MKEGKIIENVLNKEYEEYLRVVPRIGYYMRSKNISAIFKYKCPTFALAGACDVEERIYLFSNSLEEMGSFYGHKKSIRCLCGFSNRILASGSHDQSIKIWEIEERALICTLSGHRNIVTTLCYVREGVFVSGSDDKSLIIWSKLPGSNIYSQQVLTGHKSQIIGIIKINNSEIVSGDLKGDLRIWNTDQGLCTRHLPRMHYNITQMKQYMGEVAVSYREKVIIWGAANNWGDPLKQFKVCKGWPIEFLSGDILLRGGYEGELEFIYNAQTGCSLPPIQGLHSSVIYHIKRIAKNIVITSSMDRFMKVIDPISRKCYLNFKKRDNYHWFAIAYFY